jgi:hypothetical protein
MEKLLGPASFLEWLSQDPRLNVWHLALLTALYFSLERPEPGPEFQGSRRRLMKLAHIRSKSTYHKILRDLQQMGYIHYRPSYHPLMGSRFRLLAGYPPAKENSNSK